MIIKHVESTHLNEKFAMETKRQEQFVPLRSSTEADVSRGETPS